jgi:ribose-phosphate pyrophosphokinase
MINLNLVNQEKSAIKYKISQFPDGQQTVDLTDWNDLNNYADPVKITTRLNSFKDVEILICAVQAIRNLKPDQKIALYVPYFLGSRSDRKFVDGGVNYLKQVICPIINSLNFFTVIVLDPHSDVLEACLNNYEKVDNHMIVKYALTDIDNKIDAQERICLVSPDAGAYKKIFDVAKKFGINKIITANKVRDMRTGNILRTEVPVLDQHADIKYVIVDDICDGGRTFIEIAKVIKSHVWPRDEYFRGKIYLVVTHGIFSAGYAQLGEYFEAIYTTNSVKDVAETEYHALENTPTKVKQQNVF